MSYYDSPLGQTGLVTDSSQRLEGTWNSVEKSCLHLLRVDHEDDCGSSDPQINSWVLENSQGYGNVTQQVSTSRALGRGLVVHSLLFEGGVIPDPSHGRNEIIHSWVRDDTWTLRTEFEWDVDGHYDSTTLELGGIDTVADVYIDNALVATTTNMHRKYSIPIELHGRGRKHNISITLHPVEEYSDVLAGSLKYPIPHTKHLVRAGHYNLVRKVAADFGWDFAPAFAPCGILGSVQLIGRRYHGDNGLELGQVIVEQEHATDDDTVVLYPSIFLKHVEMGDILNNELVKSKRIRIPLHVTVENPASELVASSSTTDTMQHGMACQKYCTDDGMELKLEMIEKAHIECFWKCEGPPVVIKNPQLWWTWDHGPDGATDQQPLYSVTARIGAEKRTVKIGLRSFKLVREPLEKNQESFYFKLNGRMMYSKGSNIVPLNIFRDTITKEYIHQIIWAAKKGNFNTIRVWGGGGYMPDAFYEECDRQGILIWQEFMFACAAYPAHGQFLADVAAEVHQQSLRLSNHPSIVLFGFNNENENSFEWFEETIVNAGLYVVDYYALFINVIRRALRIIHPRAVYVDTSPSNGVYTEYPVYEKRWGDVMDERYGDVHFYDYSSNLLSSSGSNVFPRAKFISEFGLLSLPSLAVYSKYAQDDLSRDLMEFRTRRHNGLNEMFQQMTFHFFPKAKGSTILESLNETTLAHLIYLSQIQQALVYRNAAFHWRKEMDPSHTMGFLYWQLQQIGGWSGPSWSSLNSDASWKLLHYFVREFFAPLTHFVEYDAKKHTVSVFVSNHWHDTNPAMSFTLTVDSIPYDESSEATRHCTVSVDDSISYRRVCSFSMGLDEAKSSFVLSSISPSMNPQEQRSDHIQTMVTMPTEVAASAIAFTTVTIEYMQYTDSIPQDICPPGSSHMFTMEVSTSNAPAFYVSFEYPGVHFVDNAIQVIFPTSHSTTNTTIGRRRRRRKDRRILSSTRHWNTIRGCTQTEFDLNSIKDEISIIHLQSAISSSMI